MLRQALSIAKQRRANALSVTSTSNLSVRSSCSVPTRMLSVPTVSTRTQKVGSQLLMPRYSIPSRFSSSSSSGSGGSGAFSNAAAGEVPPVTESAFSASSANPGCGPAINPRVYNKPPNAPASGSNGAASAGPIDAASVIAAENGSAKEALLIVSGVAVGSVIITYYLQEGNRVQDFPSLLAAGFRIARLVTTAIIISADYGYVIFQTRGVETDLDRAAKELRVSNDEFTDLLRRKEHGEAVPTELLDKARQRVTRGGARMAELMSDPKNSVYHEVHMRSAARLKDMCVKNKGVYIKLGQHLSQLDYLVPAEYVDTLRALLANNPVSSLESVRKTIKEDFGAFPEEIWARFDDKPIASASLAQVHVAYGHDGKKYAVKVQHEGLFESSGADMRAITDVVTTVSRLFHDFNYEWLCREVNRNMPKELDFNEEARNIAKAQQLLVSDEVAVPSVVKSSSRVLWMSFEEGCYVTDNDKINEMKLDRGNIARIISETFSDQTFRHGFVHCDPHDANLLVRPHPKDPSRPQVVLLDHGLYRELDDDFRRNYTRLWAALVSSNVPDIQKYCGKLRAGEAYALLASVLTFRSWDDVTSSDLGRLKGQGSKNETEVLRGYAHKYFGDIISLLGKVPSDLLLVLKTNDCLRHLDRALGAPVNTAIVIAKVAADVILQEDFVIAQTMREKVMTVYFYLKLRLRANLYALFGWGLIVWNRISASWLWSETRKWKNWLLWGWTY